VLKDHWLTVYSHIADTREEVDIQSKLNTARELYRSALSESDVKQYGAVLEDFEKLYRWMYLPARKAADFTKPNQKLTQEQEDKIADKVYKLDEDECISVYEIMEKAGAFDPLNETFLKRYLTSTLISLPSTSFYAKFLKNVRQFFDKKSVEQLIGGYIRCIQALNLDSR
jgi:hypothetical protein